LLLKPLYYQNIIKILPMNFIRTIAFIVLYITGLGFMPAVKAQQPLSLQGLLQSMGSNYELLKQQGSLVQANRAAAKATDFDRLPHLNVMAQAAAGSDNNLKGALNGYGMIPSDVSNALPQSNLSAIGGDALFTGVNWEAINFGEYKANEGLAKSNLLVQMNTLVNTQYNLDGFAAAYYLELIRQYELQNVQQDNVTRVQQLKNIIVALAQSGVRPGVDSEVASAELSKSIIALQLAQKNLAQTQVQLSTLTGVASNQLIPDTAGGKKLTVDGVTFVATVAADTLHHPVIDLFSSIYKETQARLNLEKKSYYPKIFLDADAWMRGSSLNSAGVYNSDILTGYEPSRFNYFLGLTMTYDIVNIARKRLNSNIYKFQAEAASHLLENEKINLNSEVQQALIEKDFQLSQLAETKHEVDEAGRAYTQQLSLYNNGLSSIIELNTALDYYIQAQKDYVEANVGLMKSIINYSLVTNSFTALVQTLKL